MRTSEKRANHLGFGPIVWFENSVGVKTKGFHSFFVGEKELRIIKVKVLVESSLVGGAHIAQNKQHLTSTVVFVRWMMVDDGGCVLYGWKSSACYDGRLTSG